MKKLLATLLASTMALSAMGALVACGGGDDAGKGGYKDPFANVKGTWSVPAEDSYWLAGSFADRGFANEWEETTAPEGLKFSQNSDNDKLYKLEINLYSGDEFKIRFEGLGWDDQAGVSKLSADLNLLESLKNGDIGANPGGDANFHVNKDGKYEVRINTAPKDKSIVTYERLGDAPVREVSYNWFIIGGTGLNDWTNPEEVEDLAEGTLFTKQENGSYTLTIALDAGTTFKFANVGQGWSGAIDCYKCAQLGTAHADENLEGMTEGMDNGNFKVLTGGTYTFTISATNDSVSYTVVAA